MSASIPAPPGQYLGCADLDTALPWLDECEAQREEPDNEPGGLPWAA